MSHYHQYLLLQKKGRQKERRNISLSPPLPNDFATSTIKMGAKNEEKKGKRETAAPFANNNTNAHPASPGKNMNIIFFSLPFPSSPASFLPYLLQDLPTTTTTTTREKPPFVRTRVCDLTTPRQPSPPLLFLSPKPHVHKNQRREERRSS